MKKLISFFLLLSIYNCVVAQNINLEGEWKGTYTLDTNQNRQVLDFSIKFRQSGNAVWGIFVRGKETGKNKADCVGRFTFGLNSQNNSGIIIYNDGIEKNNILLSECFYMNSLEADYSKKVNAELLEGVWFGNPSASRYGLAVPSGTFKLEKINAVADIEIDNYFPKLAKLIRKFNYE